MGTGSTATAMGPMLKITSTPSAISKITLKILITLGHRDSLSYLTFSWLVLLVTFTIFISFVKIPGELNHSVMAWVCDQIWFRAQLQWLSLTPLKKAKSYRERWFKGTSNQLRWDREVKVRNSGKYTFFVENDRRQKLYKVYAAGAFRGKTLELLLYPLLVENQPFIDTIVKN